MNSRLTNMQISHRKVVQSSSMFVTLDDKGNLEIQVSASPKGGDLHQIVSLVAQTMYDTMKEEWEKRKKEKK